MSAKCSSFTRCQSASTRKPSTPRSSQKRSTSSIACTTAGLRQLRSGCSAGRRGSSTGGRFVELPRAAAKQESQLFGGPPPGAGSRQMYQSRRNSRARRATRGTTDAGRRCGSAPSTTLRPRVRLRDEPVEVLERAEERIDAGVVGHVVAEVLHRRGIDRREPQRVDAQPLEVIQARDHARRSPTPSPSASANERG